MHENTRKQKYSGNPSVGQLEKWRINNHHREIDLVSVLNNPKAIIQTETKSSEKTTGDKTKMKRTREAIEQLKFFKDYLTRIHASAAEDFIFIPTIAFPKLRMLPQVKSQCYCQNENTGQYRAAAFFKVTEDPHAVGTWFLNKGYETCASTVQGEGCLFFKWHGEDRPSQPTLTVASTEPSNCLCDRETVMICVPQNRPNQIGKTFKVCPAQDKPCEFFAWIDEAERDTNALQRKTVFKDSLCKKHFVFKQHVNDASEFLEWWNQICTQSQNTQNATGNNQYALRDRLIVTASMVFTRLPRLLSRMTSDSQLILMRYIKIQFEIYKVCMTYRRTQLEVISKRPDRALLKGPRQNGKRLCLEVGKYVLEY